MLGNRDGARAVGAACPNLWAVWALGAGRCPQTVSPNVEVSTFYIFVSFLSVKRPTGKNKWPKTDEKARFRVTLGFFPS